MPRLFTALEVPPEVTAELSLFRGGIPGTRWLDPENYHITLRFIGDVDHAAAREVAHALSEAKPASAFEVVIDGFASFGGDRPRALIARVRPSPELLRLQAEGEKLVRRAGLPAETRKFVPHVTLARLRDARSGDVAAFMARAGHLPPLRFTAGRLVLFSSRDGVGGGPYLVEAAYPFRGSAGPRLGSAPQAGCDDPDSGTGRLRISAGL